jgi:hypothetical protein
MNTSVIRNAIANKQVIEFSYKGHIRIAEPHIYGIKNEKRQLLVYQIGGGTSSGGIPDWRRVDLNDISGMKVTQEKFSARQEVKSGNRADWDLIIAIAE